MKNQPKVHKKVPFLLWFIPMMSAIAAFLAFTGVAFAAVFRWMGTLKVQKKAAQIYIDEHTRPAEKEPRAHLL